MEYNITTVEKAKETLIKIKNNWPGIQLENVDYSKFDFILEHITTNMDNCKQIKSSGLKTVKELIEEPDNEFIKFCINGSYKSKKEIEECIEYYKKYNNEISAFFSYEDGKRQYGNNLEIHPEIFDKRQLGLGYIAKNEWEQKSKTYKITVKARFEEIDFNVIRDEDITIKLTKNLIRRVNNEEIKECIVGIKNTIEPSRLFIEEIKRKK